MTSCELNTLASLARNSGSPIRIVSALPKSHPEAHLLPLLRVHGVMTRRVRGKSEMYAIETSTLLSTSTSSSSLSSISSVRVNLALLLKIPIACSLVGARLMLILNEANGAAVRKLSTTNIILEETSSWVQYEFHIANLPQDARLSISVAVDYANKTKCREVATVRVRDLVISTLRPLSVAASSSLDTVERKEDVVINEEEEDDRFGEVGDIYINKNVLHFPEDHRIAKAFAWRTSSTQDFVSVSWMMRLRTNTVLRPIPELQSLSGNIAFLWTLGIIRRGRFIEIETGRVEDEGESLAVWMWQDYNVHKISIQQEGCISFSNLYANIIIKDDLCF